MHTVAVYGTLRREGSRGHVLKDSRFLGEGKTDEHFFMCDMGSYPGAVPGGDTPMVVELYEVSDDTLRVLDRIEGTIRGETRNSYYNPHDTTVDGVACSVYVINNVNVPQMYPVISSGDWIKYVNQSELV